VEVEVEEMTGRVAKAVLVSAVPPLVLKTAVTACHQADDRLAPLRLVGRAACGFTRLCGPG
jgi:hypothetical protein